LGAAIQAATLATPVAMAAAALRRVLADYVRLAKAQAKLTLVLLGLFIGLYKEGFCRPHEEKDGEGEGGGKLSDDVEGTGMAEGVGKKDVSDEIENEDQLGTDAPDKEEEKDDSGEEKKEKAKGIEMQQEFDAELEDLSEDEADEVRLSRTPRNLSPVRCCGLSSPGTCRCFRQPRDGRQEFGDATL
jgi:midasin (ATPase involved in ribosome maturation)